MEDKPRFLDANGRLRPGAFIGQNLSYVITAGFLVPLVFMVALHSHFVNLSWLDLQILRAVLGKIFPVSVECYDYILLHDGAQKAHLYAAFLLVASFSLLAICGVSFSRYLPSQDQVGKPNAGDVILTTMGFLLFFSTRSSSIDPPASEVMSIDRFGLFFFKQYFILLGLCISCLDTLFSIRGLTLKD